jgi:hypothetical protein
MNGGRRIIPIDVSQPDTGAAAPVLELGEAMAEAPAIAPTVDEPWDEPVPIPETGWRSRLAPMLTGLAIAVWTGFFGWANAASARDRIDPAQVAQLLVQWSVPVLLFLVCLLLLVRGNVREADRMFEVSRALRSESAQLDRRLGSMNNELALARDFIAAQSRDLEALGRIAVDRLGGTAFRLQELIAGNGEQVDRIASVASSALDNMEKLRGQLPVIANSAKDVTNSIANAGRAAHLQLEDMVGGFQRLNEFGVASERQVTQVREKVDEALATFTKSAEWLGEVSSARFGALKFEGDAHRERLASAENAALDALRNRSQALADELAEHRAAAVEADNIAFEAMRARFNSLREDSVRLAQSIGASESEALTAWNDRSNAQVSALTTALQDLGTRQDQSLAEAAERLAAFEEAARSLTALLDDQARSFDDQLARRRASAESNAADQRSAMARRLAEIDEAIAERRIAMASAGAEAADALAHKLAELDNVIEAQRLRQLNDAHELANHCEAVGDRITAFSATLRECGDTGSGTADAVDTALATLNLRLSTMRDSLSGTDLQLGELTDAAVRLLELIQAGSDHTRTQLPEALRGTEAGLKRIEERVFMLRDSLREAGDSGRLVSDAMVSTREQVTGTADEFSRIHAELIAQTSEQDTRVASLREVVTSVRAESDALSQDIDGRLAGAIAHLSEAARDVGTQLREGTATEIAALAERLGEESNAAIARVLQGRAAELIARLEEAIDTASSSGREAAIQMRDQLAKVDELAGNLETRVTRARERAEEQVDNDFARRAALITESLNSTSIDIAKALSSDVSETAWASYLRGDRGIFTRRAVSLLDSAEAKAVQQHYEAEREFRDHVNRYIHDFETMLRQLLSTRDGNALGVTLLSSDMGKLYVALAQGIERLRA